MKWFDKNSSEEDVLEEIQSKFGLMKRNNGVEIRPDLPYKRPLSIMETKIMRKYFDSDYKWTDIDAKGKIILIDLTSPVQIGQYYVTEEDLKNQIRREKML